MYSTLKAVFFAGVLASSSLALSSHKKTCTDYDIPVTPTSVNLIWGKKFVTNFDIADFISNINSRTAATSFNPYDTTAAPVLTTASYTISATFCTPKKGATGTVLLLSHGLNFDRNYWDPEVSKEDYSFVDWAIARGYSIFYYDRPGVGKSTLVSGYVNQASIQIAILEELATAVKAGKYTGQFGTPKSLVLVGHSFGSVISSALATAVPSIAEGLVLTGFSFNGTNGAGFLEAFQPRIASGESSKWASLDTGYLTPTDIYSNVNVFFKAPDYDVDIAKYANRNRQPFGINEATSGGLVDVAPLNFTGPAMVIAGQFDLIFCTGQCDDVIEHPAKEIFRKAKAFKAISYPGAGHGLNFALNATGAFDLITDFLNANGL
ncbi:Alpha/Beta hydrolase protein [Rhexocercosporidium sp. MPI-PUGE-AT-0058]|nr:Alpha/Beta hydrolase protein [Rhexocercosporidium sp. MPI-PUGE-AT-0058]